MKYLPYPKQSPQPGQRGFTLVELVVTLAVVGVLTTLAVPMFGELMRNWRRDTATRALLDAVSKARGEAIKSTRKVMMCPSTNGTSCANSTNWSTGWIVFVDDGATDQAFDVGERLVVTAGAQAGIASMIGTGNVKFLQFLPSGLLARASTAGAATGPTNIVVTPSGLTSSTKVNKVDVNQVGRVATATEYP